MFGDDVVPNDDQISDQTNELQEDEWEPAIEAILVQKAMLNKRWKNEQEKLF